MKKVNEQQCNSCSHVDKTDVEHICNACGESCSVKKAADSGEPGGGSYGLIDAVAKGYFYSPVLEDCTAYKFDICEKCLKEMFDKFIIPVEEKEYHIWTGEINE